MRKGLSLLLIALTTILMLMTSVVHAADAANTFSITSTATLNEGPLPVLYTCDGKNVSLQLAWTNPPAKTQSFAIVMTDPDAPGGEFYHWILYNLPKATTQLDEGVTALPAGTLVGQNSFDKKQYNGPCPPKGSAHTYVITLYGLSSKLSLPAGKSGKEVLAAIKPHVVGTATFKTTYSRWIQ